MKLISLNTTNFKKLGNFSAQFTDGLNVIIGENWAGKSTLLHAIVTAMYGVQVLPGKKEDFPTWGQKNFSVELTLEHLGETYKITRDMKNAKAEGADGGLLASGNTTVTKFVEETIGLQFKDFALFVLSQQGETAGVMTFGATALQQRVEAFSGAELLDEVLTKVRAETAFLTRSVSSEDAAGVEDQLTKARDDYSFAHQVQVDAETRVSSLEASLEVECLHGAELDSLRIRQVNACNQYEIVRDRLSHCEMTANNMNLSIETAEQDLSQLPEWVDPVELVEQIEEITTQYKTKYREYETLVGVNKNIELWGSRLPQLKQASIDSASAEAKLTELSALVEAAKSKSNAAGAASQLSDRRVDHATREQETGICSKCDRPLEGFNLVEANAKIQEAKVVRDKHSAEFSVAGKALRKLKEDAAVQRQRVSPKAETVYDSRLSEFQVWQEVAAHSPSENELENAVNLLDDQKTNLNNRMTKTQMVEGQRTKLTAYLAKEIAARKLVERETRAQYDAFDKVTKARAELIPSGKFDSVQGDMSALISKQTGKVTALRKEWDEVNNERFDSSAQASTYLSLIETLTDTKEHVKTQAINLDKHKRLAKYLTESRSTYMKNVWDQILGMASSTLTTATGGDLTRILRDEKGTFIAEEGGKLVPVANCSGAQKGFIGVALRVGLSSALYGNTGLLILDEPTADMNDARALQLSGALMGLSGQCITITHRQFEQLAAQNVIQVN